MSLQHSIAALALLVWPVAVAFAQEPATVTVKIAAFNDFHGYLQSPGDFDGVPAGGADVLAGYIAELKRRNPYNVVVSAGDLFGASPLVSALFHDEATIEAMNRLGLELNAVGNHEFDKGKEELLRLQRGGCHADDPAHSCQGAAVGTPVPFEGARFSFLAANVVHTGTDETLFPAYAIKQFGPARVGFIGVGLKETPSIVSAAGVVGLTFTDEAESINAVIPKLRAEGVQAIVVLVHQGGAQSIPPTPPDINACHGDLDNTDGTPSPIKQIVSRLDGAVDLVISGHTHQTYNCRLPNASGRRIPVTSANAFGRVLTDIDISIDPSVGRVVDVTARNLVVNRTDAVAPDPLIRRIVQQYSALAAPIANRVIGTVAHDIPNKKDRACEMPAGDLIADAQLTATAPVQLGAAQIALMNPGGVRAAGFLFDQSSGGEARGEITYAEAFSVQPFSNYLVTMTLTAQQLKDVLEQQFKGCALAGEPVQTMNRVLLPSAGFTFRWDLTKPACHKIVAMSLETSDGTTDIVRDGDVVDTGHAYRVTVNNHLAAGGDGFTVFARGTQRLDGILDIDALVAYFARFKAPDAAYRTSAAGLDRPRITRADAGSACP